MPKPNKKETSPEHPNVEVKDLDDVAKILVDVKEVLTDTAKGQGEIREAQEKIKTDLHEQITEHREFKTVTEAQLTKLTEEHDKETKSVFDVVLNQETVREMWGYKDDVTRALYKTHTNWNRKKGWVHDGNAYDVDPVVMQLNDFLYLMGMHKAIASQRNPDRAQNYKEAVQNFESYKLFRYELERDSSLRKAMNTDDNADFIPTGLSAQLIDDIRLELQVAALFPDITMPAGVGSWELPVRGARREAKIIGEPQTDSPSKVPTADVPSGKVAFSAVTHGLRMLFSYELDEDSAIAMMPLVREEIIQAIRDAKEIAIVNGDTSTTHQDSDVTSANDVRKSWTGLRKHSDSDINVDIGTVNLDNLRSLYKGMGRFGVNPANRAWITSIAGIVEMLKLDEVLTMDKIGNQATVRTGQLATLDGSPIIVSEFVREDLNASGVYDGSTTDNSLIICANTRAFYNASKPSGMLIETDRDIETQQQVAVASHRVDFKQVQTPSSGEETVAVGYNVPV